jgi:lipopolysaccharide transport system ATP-binding protein
MVHAIQVHGLGKMFKQYSAGRHLKIKHLLTGWGRRRSAPSTFWCLRDVTFDVPQGSMVGIIGPNGSGKSTLLRLIGGVGHPDEGSVSVKGRIGALLDLGAGFYQDLSGRDNIYITGVIAGLTRAQVSRRFDEIVSFSELESSIESPLWTYSSGMKMRLAFAVAVNIDPEILLIDEVLFVGDMSFQSKCLERIQQFKNRGCTVLLISHDNAQVEKLCDSVIWLKKGRIKGQGSPRQIIQAYADEISVETRRRTPTDSVTRDDKQSTLRLNENRFGSLEVEIADVRLFGPTGNGSLDHQSGDPLTIEIDYISHIAAEKPIFGITISREDGQICCEMMSDKHRFDLDNARQQGTMTLEVERLDFSNGNYYVDVGIYEKDWEYAFDYHWHVYPLKIISEYSSKGIVRPPHNWSWSDRESLGKLQQESVLQETLSRND